MNSIDRALEILRREGAASLVARAGRGSLMRLVELLKSPLHIDTERDPCTLLFTEFFDEVRKLERPRVLELGSRARSGTVYRGRLGDHVNYVGLDVMAGENVDVVSDVHALSEKLAPASFDAIFSVSVFEHLAMPWKAVLEMNQVLKPGGLVYVGTHPTYPPHDEPWDFWRYNRGAFRALFNARTGFELLRCEEGLPCSIVPLAGDAPLRGLWREKAYLSIGALARKTGNSELSWNVKTSDVIDEQYPA